jgi:uncharacterized protein (DUF849 family)
MEGMRGLLKGTLGSSLRSLQEEDRLAVAWPVVCGKAMAEHGTVLGYAGGVVRVGVEDGTWMRQMMTMKRQLEAELALIAGVKVTKIHFEVKRNDRQ